MTDATEMTDTPLVLGIETSCDETGVGIVRGSEVLANVVASSMAEHARFGGVVPEIAARAHLESIDSVIAEAFRQAGVEPEDLDAVAVTIGPGLMGALLVGAAAGKAMAAALGKPFYAVNHLVGHVAADLLHFPGEEPKQPLGPTIALLVSGGHTEILHIQSITDQVTLLGSTIDDAAGEAFDKVSRMLGLGYPGGPAIDAAAAGGNPAAVRFPRALSLPKDMEQHRYDFSFSGLKTAAARWVEQHQDRGVPVPVADTAASFREAVIDVLTAKAVAACRDLGVPNLLLGGGVAANRRLREVLAERCAAEGIALRIPPLSVCTDNGAMIAGLGSLLLRSGAAPSDLGVSARSSLSFTQPML